MQHAVQYRASCIVGKCEFSIDPNPSILHPSGRLHTTRLLRFIGLLQVLEKSVTSKLGVLYLFRFIGLVQDIEQSVD